MKKNDKVTEKDSKKADEHHRYKIYAGMAIVAAAVAIYFRYNRKNTDSASSGLQTAAASNLTIPLLIAATAPTIGAGLQRYSTMPAQEKLEVKREGLMRTSAEMDSAYKEGLSCMGALPASDEKKPDERKSEERVNYIRAAEQFRKARLLLNKLPHAEGNEAFLIERNRTCLYNEALSLFLLGIYQSSEPNNAMSILTELLKEHPNDRASLNLRGLIYLKLGSLKEAAIDFEASLREMKAQNDIYVCWLYAKNQLASAQSSIESKETVSTPEYQKYLKANLQIPCKEKHFTGEILLIKAKIAFAEKDYVDVINCAETAYAILPKHPGTFAEKLRIYELLTKGYQELIALNQDCTFQLYLTEPNGNRKRPSICTVDAMKLQLRKTNDKIKLLQEECRLLSSTSHQSL